MKVLETLLITKLGSIVIVLLFIIIIQQHFSIKNLGHYTSYFHKDVLCLWIIKKYRFYNFIL